MTRTHCPDAGRRLVCRHCTTRHVNRPRGLCWSCYYAPGVREQYPSTSKYARRGVGNGNGTQPLPAPTDTIPGSPERLAVLAERARLRQQLFHPDDLMLDVSDRPEPRLPTACERTHRCGFVLPAEPQPSDMIEWQHWGRTAPEPAPHE